MDNPEVILLVKYKQFFIPADVKSYRALCSLNMPVTRINEDLIPLIKDHAVRRGYELRGQKWSSVVARATKKLEKYWTETHPNCVVEFRKRQWIFSTNKAAAYDQARVALPKLEKAIRDFLNRWGFSGEFVPSESRERLKLSVTYRMDLSRMPAVEVRKDIEDIEPLVFTFGFNRLSIRQEKRSLKWVLEQQSGNAWIQRFSSTCLPSEIGDPSALVKMLLELSARTYTPLPDPMPEPQARL